MTRREVERNVIGVAEQLVLMTIRDHNVRVSVAFVLGTESVGDMSLFVTCEVSPIIGFDSKRFKHPMPLSSRFIGALIFLAICAFHWIRFMRLLLGNLLHFASAFSKAGLMVLSN